MPGKKLGCGGRILAGLCRTVVVPVLVNVLTQEVQDLANRAAARKAAPAPNPPAASADWSCPAPPHPAPRLRGEGESEVPGGLEPPVYPVSGERLGRWAKGLFRGAGY